jgi:polysaccharide export outer membrane protein
MIVTRLCQIPGSDARYSRRSATRRPIGGVSICMLFVLLGLLVCAVGGCAAHKRPELLAESPLATLQMQSSQPAVHRPYRLQIGDKIAVKFYQNPDLNEEVEVRPDGIISLQLIGDVRAAGVSPEALAARLAQRYKNELAKPKISVIVRQFSGNQVYIGGEVARQGVVPFTAPRRRRMPAMPGRRC